MRRSHCEAELIQAAGRGRGTLRTASNPLDVLILTHTPLGGVEVTEARTLDDVWLELGGEDLVRPMLEAGVLPSDWPGVGAVLTAVGRLQWAKDPGDAARKAFDRDQSMKAALATVRKAAYGANNGRFSYINILMRNVRYSRIGGWAALTYRRPGQRKSARVLIAPWHADPRAATENVLGPLETFAPVGQPARRPRVARPHTAPVPGAVLPAQAPTAGTGPTQALPAPDAHATPTGAPAAATTPDLEARIASVQLGLPPVLAALQAAGRLSKADRQRILDWFRRMPGARSDREHEVLLKFAGKVGPHALQAAARQAALAALGETRQAPV